MVNQEVPMVIPVLHASVFLGALPGGFRASRERSLLSLLPYLIISLLRRINPKPNRVPLLPPMEIVHRIVQKMLPHGVSPSLFSPNSRNNATRDSSRFFPEECFAPS